MKRYVKCSDESYDPFNGHKYRVDGDVGQTYWTDDPTKAVEQWFKYQKTSPSNVNLMSKYKDDAIELVNSLDENLLVSLYKKYKIPYKLEYLLESWTRQIDNDCRYFHESKYGYGDSIDPFTVG